MYFSNTDGFSLLLCPLMIKRGSIFLFWTENVFPNWSSVFCPRMAKGGVC
jgi:hypothetical protein